MAAHSSVARSLRIGPRLVAAVGLLIAIAGVLAPPERTPAEGLPTPIWIPVPDWLIIATAAACTTASVILVVIVRPWRRARRKVEEEFRLPPERPSPLLAALMFLLALTPLILLGAAFFWLERSDLSIRLNSISVVDMLQASPMAPAQPASPITTGLIGVLMVLAGAGSLGFALWLALAGRLQQPPREPSSPHNALSAAVEDSLDELRREAEPRAAIIRIYDNFERAVAAAALPRRPWQTPVEFMRIVLGNLALPATPIANLTRLFELARFSRHPVGVEERETAWHSLIEIRAALAQESLGPTDADSS